MGIDSQGIWEWVLKTGVMRRGKIGAENEE
jgi:hypothetical protein